MDLTHAGPRGILECWNNGIGSNFHEVAKNRKRPAIIILGCLHEAASAKAG